MFPTNSPKNQTIFNSPQLKVLKYPTFHASFFSEAQARLRELEQSVEQGYDPEAHTPVPIVDKPLSMKEILDRQGIEVCLT